MTSPDPIAPPASPPQPPIPPMQNAPSAALNPYLLSNVNVIGAYLLAAICLVGAIILAVVHDGQYAADAFSLFQYVVLGLIGGSTATTIVHAFRNGSR